MTVSKMEMDGSMPPAVPALMMASTRQLSMRTWAAMAALTLQTPLYRAAAGDPSLVDREHGLPADGAPVQKRQERRELVISGAQDSDFGEHVPSLLFAEQLRLWGYCNTQRLGAQSKIAQNIVVWYNIIVISI